MPISGVAVEDSAKEEMISDVCCILHFPNELVVYLLFIVVIQVLFLHCLLRYISGADNMSF